MNDPSMQSGGSRGMSRGSGTGRTAAFSAARGALLVGLAVIIGIVLLQVIDDGTTGPIGDGGAAATGATTTTTAASGTSDATTTTTSGGAVKPPAEVPVLVQNGSGRPGAARAQTDALKAKGYQTLTPSDAPSRTGTVVYYKPGLERECTSVATAVGGNPKVEAIPSPAPTGSENASCVVILGA
jgi:hypothetical protein